MKLLYEPVAVRRNTAKPCPKAAFGETPLERSEKVGKARQVEILEQQKILKEYRERRSKRVPITQKREKRKENKT